MDAALVQACVVVPLIAGLLARVLLRARRSPVHWSLAGLLAAILAWVASETAAITWGRTGYGVDAWLGLVAATTLPPLYLLTIGLRARVAALESPATRAALFAPFAVFAALILTNDLHGLVFHGTVSARIGAARSWAGPGFWAYQLWTYTYVAAGLAICFRHLTRSAEERRQALLILAATAVPMATTTLQLLGILGTGYPFGSGALGVSSALLVVGIDRLGLLGDGVLMQHDVIAELSDGLVLADASGTIVDSNGAAEAILGAPGSTLRGSSLRAALAPLLADHPLADELGELRLRPAPVEHAIEAPDGRSLELHAGSVRVQRGEPAGCFVLLRDRTHQRRHERILHQRQRLESLGVLAAGVAHEVNNPLAFVRANLVHLRELGFALAKRDASPQAAPAELGELEEVLDESLVGLDRIAGIVASLLRLARPASELRERVSLADVADDALRFADLHRAAGIRVEVEHHRPLPEVEASLDRMVQVVLNLLLNARQALAERGGVLRVETVHEEGHVALRVRDDGPGMSDAVRERIFDPFFTTRAPGEGTGLGLSIAFDIVREHGGTLEAESSPGRGSCFVVRLPTPA